MPVRPLMDVAPRRRPQENLLVLGEACPRTSIKDKPAKLSAQSLTLGFLEVYRNFRIFKECGSVDVSDTVTRPLQDAEDACTQQALQSQAAQLAALSAVCGARASEAQAPPLKKMVKPRWLRGGWRRVAQLCLKQAPRPCTAPRWAPPCPGGPGGPRRDCFKSSFRKSKSSSSP